MYPELSPTPARRRPSVSPPVTFRRLLPRHDRPVLAGTKATSVALLHQKRGPGPEEKEGVSAVRPRPPLVVEAGHVCLRGWRRSCGPVHGHASRGRAPGLRGPRGPQGLARPSGTASPPGVRVAYGGKGPRARPRFPDDPAQWLTGAASVVPRRV